MEERNPTVETPDQAGSADPRPDTALLSDPSAYAAALAAERDQLQQEKNDLYDRLLRRQAEFDNFRKRVERERSELGEYAAMEAVRAMLPILDDFERALKVESANTEYSKGMELIYGRMRDALTRLGLEPIQSAGQKFDPYMHHAVDRVPTTGSEEDTILEEYQRGYNFKGKLLRPAMVRVAVRP